MFDAAPDAFGSSQVIITTAALAVGLLTGFAGGYVTGQRHDGGVPSGSTGQERPAAIDPADAAPDVLAQSYTETPVTEIPAPVAMAEVAPPPAPRPSTTRPAAQARPTGALFVVSRPAGAQVFLDGRLVGKTPVSLSDVAAGRHMVRIALPDHRRWATPVTVSAGTSARVAASLER